MLTKAKITMGNILDNVMPGITKLLYDRTPNHKLTDFVLRYLHFDKISAMGEKRFTTDYCKWAKKTGIHFIRTSGKGNIRPCSKWYPCAPYDLIHHDRRQGSY